MPHVFVLYQCRKKLFFYTFVVIVIPSDVEMFGFGLHLNVGPLLISYLVTEIVVDFLIFFNCISMMSSNMWGSYSR